jgi:hypothetical protein
VFARKMVMDQAIGSLIQKRWTACFEALSQS